MKKTLFLGAILFSLLVSPIFAEEETFKSLNEKFGESLFEEIMGKKGVTSVGEGEMIAIIIFLSVDEEFVASVEKELPNGERFNKVKEKESSVFVSEEGDTITLAEYKSYLEKVKEILVSYVRLALQSIEEAIYLEEEIKAKGQKEAFAKILNATEMTESSLLREIEKRKKIAKQFLATLK